MEQVELEQFYFGEQQLETYLSRLKVYENLKEAIDLGLFSRLKDGPPIRPKDKMERRLLGSLPGGATIKTGRLENEECLLVKIPATEKSAKIVYVLGRDREEEKEWSVWDFIIIDRESGKSVNLIDVVPPEEGWKVKYELKGDPRYSWQEKVLYIGPPSGLTASLFSLRGLRVEASLHEIGHGIKREEEKALLKITLKKYILATMAVFCYPLFVPLALLSRDYHELRKMAAQIDRKASAIGLRFIRRMRQLGVDPLPSVSSKEIVSSYKRALLTKDIFSLPGQRVFSR